jgi:hypothetical protein
MMTLLSAVRPLAPAFRSSDFGRLRDIVELVRPAMMGLLDHGGRAAGRHQTRARVPLGSLGLEARTLYLRLRPQSPFECGAIV